MTDRERERVKLKYHSSPVLKRCCCLKCLVIYHTHPWTTRRTSHLSDFITLLRDYFKVGSLLALSCEGSFQQKHHLQLQLGNSEKATRCWRLLGVAPRKFLLGVHNSLPIKILELLGCNAEGWAVLTVA